MSFRVKTTHKLLDPNGIPPPQNTQNTFISLLKKDDEKGSFLDDDFVDTAPVRERPQENRPKASSNQGVAIRVIPTAQADHM